MSTAEWIKTTDPNGKTLWVNTKTYQTSYDAPFDYVLNTVNDLNNSIAVLESKLVWARVRGDKSIMKGKGLKLRSVSGNIYHFVFDTPRKDDNYGVVTSVHRAYWRTWGRVDNITTNGFDVAMLTETNESVTNLDLEITVQVTA